MECARRLGGMLTPSANPVRLTRVECGRSRRRRPRGTGIFTTMTGIDDDDDVVVVLDRTTFFDFVREIDDETIPMWSIRSKRLNLGCFSFG